MTADDLGFDAGALDRVGRMCHGYVDAGKLPGTLIQVSRRGQIAYQDVYGHADVATGRPLAIDSIFRIYSMTKPICSIGLMQLNEEGRFLLEDRLARYLPEFGEVQVWDGGTEEPPRTRPPAGPITVHDVLRHTSGLTYGFMFQNPVDALYRAQGLGDFGLPGYDLTEGISRLAQLPLLFDPGTRWNYSMSTDVCGRLIEVISGQSLDSYLEERVLGPLGMVDTGFYVPADKADRLCANYTKGRTGLAEIDPAATSRYLDPPKFLSGGGGLVSTVADYQRFCDMLLRGGELDGTRIIGRKTLGYMTTNHLPGGVTLNDMGQSTFSETFMAGTGFGLGFSVIVDPAANGAIGSVGEFSWGGAASTVFWVDPSEELTVIFMTQLVPSDTYPIRRQLKATVLGALRV